jgi:hypothetical protein
MEEAETIHEELHRETARPGRPSTSRSSSIKPRHTRLTSRSLIRATTTLAGGQVSLASSLSSRLKRSITLLRLNMGENSFPMTAVRLIP